MDVLIYVTQNNKIVKQPLNVTEFRNPNGTKELVCKCNMATRGFVLGANVRNANVKIPQVYLNPIEAYHQDNPFYMNLNNLADDDFRGQNETFTFNL